MKSKTGLDSPSVLVGEQSTPVIHPKVACRGRPDSVSLDLCLHYCRMDSAKVEQPSNRDRG